MDVLKVESLSKEYDGKVILDSIDISIKKGQFVTILGPSGCGKSTLFKIINGLDKIYLGSCKVEGVEGRERETESEIGERNRKNKQKKDKKIREK